MATSTDLNRKLEAMWDDLHDRQTVLAELERYGQESFEREPERVRLAILKLCGGRVERVSELVAAAKQDYRDVLMWAEYPAEGQALWTLKANLTDEERRQLERLRQEDRREYQEWLKQ